MGKMSDDAQLEIFSQGRLAGYNGTQEHEDNLILIAQIAHKIGILEIVVRNKIDSLLSVEDKDWLQKLPQKLLPRDLEKYTKDEIISKQTMGFWVKVAADDNIGNKINDEIFETDFLDSLDFKKYFYKNKNRFRNSTLRRRQKTLVILELLRVIRNRAFHFENLYKFENAYPRLNAVVTDDKGHRVYIAIQPDKIKDFLNDVLASFHPDLIGYAEKCERKESARGGGD